jgi:hypothetical protein
VHKEVLAMPDRNRPERLQIMLDSDELSALDDWRFAHRMPSRAAAIRELLKRGLAVEQTDSRTTGRQSASFGVLGGRVGHEETSLPTGDNAA